MFCLLFFFFFCFFCFFVFLLLFILFVFFFFFCFYFVLFLFFWLRTIQKAMAVHIFNFPKFKFAPGNLLSKEGNFGKQTRLKIKE